MCPRGDQRCIGRHVSATLLQTLTPCRIYVDFPHTMSACLQPATRASFMVCVMFISFSLGSHCSIRNRPHNYGFTPYGRASCYQHLHRRRQHSGQRGRLLARSFAGCPTSGLPHRQGRVQCTSPDMPTTTSGEVQDKARATPTPTPHLVQLVVHSSDVHLHIGVRLVQRSQPCQWASEGGGYT